MGGTYPFFAFRGSAGFGFVISFVTNFAPDRLAEPAIVGGVKRERRLDVGVPHEQPELLRRQPLPVSQQGRSRRQLNITPRLIHETALSGR